MRKFTVFILFTYFLQSFAGYGDEQNGYPNWQERAAHAVTNAVRSDPTNYVSKYGADYSPSMSGILSGYAVKPPLYWTVGLNTVSRTYSTFLSGDTCFGHGFCNGTDTGSYIEEFYACAADGWAENIAAGYGDPRTTINQWLCDGSPCVAAGGSAGHRQNILDTYNYGLQGLGNGYVYRSGSAYSYYWTQDFGATICPAVSNKIASGSHIFQNSGKTKFLASFYDSASGTPSVASVFIQGTQYSLSLDLGTASLGTYVYEGTSGTSCRDYYFYFVDSSGNSFYYPETGSLETYQEGSCTTAWVSTRSGSSAATSSTSAASSTSATATTAAATTAAATTAAATTAAATTGAASTTGAVTTGSSSGVFGPVSTSTTSTTGSSLYYGTTISYVMLTIAGSVSGFVPATFANEIATCLSISADRIVIQNVAAGSQSGTVEVDFTILEKTGEESSYNVMYDLYNKIVAGDSSFAQNGLQIYSFSGYFINNPSGASIPSAPTSEPSLSAKPPSDTSKKSTNVALIGGVVGGAVGLIAIIGVIVAVVVVRKRRGSSPGSFF